MCILAAGKESQAHLENLGARNKTLWFFLSFPQSLRAGDFTEICILDDSLMKEYKLWFYEKEDQPDESQEQVGWLWCDIPEQCQWHIII